MCVCVCVFHIIFKIYCHYFLNRIKCFAFVIQIRVVARCENFRVFNAKANDIYNNQCHIQVWVSCTEAKTTSTAAGTYISTEVSESLPPGHIWNTLCTFTSHCGNVLYVTSTTDLQPIKFCKQRVWYTFFRYYLSVKFFSRDCICI